MGYIADINEYLGLSRFKGYFCYTDFFEDHAQLFIILGIFSALTFYLHTYAGIDDINITLSDFLYINGESTSIFICIILMASFFIEIILAWAILSEAIRYNGKYSYRKESTQSVSLNLYSEIKCILKRYLFVFLFYAFIFYNIYYLASVYLQIFEPVLILLSIFVQSALASVMYEQLQNKADLDIVDLVKDKEYNWIQPFITFTMSASILAYILFIYIRLGPSKGNLGIFFLFPVILFITLFYIGTNELIAIGKNIKTMILENKRPDDLKGQKTGLSAYVTITVIISFFLILFVIAGMSFNSQAATDTTNNNSPIVGDWDSIDGQYSFSFYENNTFTAEYCSCTYYGGWRRCNDTCYKIAFDSKDYPYIFNNCTTWVIKNDSNMIYALNDTRLWLSRK